MLGPQGSVHVGWFFFFGLQAGDHAFLPVEQGSWAIDVVVPTSFGLVGSPEERGNYGMSRNCHAPRGFCIGAFNRAAPLGHWGPPLLQCFCRTRVLHISFLISQPCGCLVSWPLPF